MEFTGISKVLAFHELSRKICKEGEISIPYEYALNEWHWDKKKTDVFIDELIRYGLILKSRKKGLNLITMAE
jgi:hypothetical protein